MIKSQMRKILAVFKKSKMDTSSTKLTREEVLQLVATYAEEHSTPWSWKLVNRVKVRLREDSDGYFWEVIIRKNRKLFYLVNDKTSEVSFRYPPGR